MLAKADGGRWRLRLWLLGILAKGTAALELRVWRQWQTPGFFTAAQDSCRAKFPNSYGLH